MIAVAAGLPAAGDPMLVVAAGDPMLVVVAAGGATAHIHQYVHLQQTTHRKGTQKEKLTFSGNRGIWFAVRAAHPLMVPWYCRLTALTSI